MAESGVPKGLALLWQRGRSGWTGSWTVRLEDGTHAVSAVIRPGLAGSRLTINFDGQTIDSSLVLMYIGEIRRLERNGHTFALRVKGYGMLGEFALFVDGNEVARDGVAATVPERPVRAAASSPQFPQFQRELNVIETEEVIGVEEYPLDNAFGDLALTTDRQVSKASTNDVSVETTQQLSGNVNVQVLAALKAEIAGQLSKQVGSKVGETVTESQTLHLSVGPHASVLYRVLWKRRVRTGDRVYLVGTGEVTVPYRMTYGLSCEVRSQELKPQP